MKKIITAIGNSMLNKTLEGLGKYEIVGKDIQYKEGILEVLEYKKDIDVLIISELLEGNIDFKELIINVLKINKNIEIIVFVDNENKELRNFLYEKGIYKIYENNKIELNELERIIENDNHKTAQELTDEIKKLKQIIETQKMNIRENEKIGKISIVTGNYGSRKKYIIMHTLQRIFKKQKENSFNRF